MGAGVWLTSNAVFDAFHGFWGERALRGWHNGEFLDLTHASGVCQNPCKTAPNMIASLRKCEPGDSLKEASKY